MSRPRASFRRRPLGRMPSRSFEDLVALIARLRDPVGGCPWDRSQDHRSLRPYVLEEAHEAIAAIDAGDRDALADELGDLLLQVLLHSRIAEESGAFSVGDVIERIAAKLIRRHPHVFGEASGDLPSVHRRWREIKEGEGRRSFRMPPLLAARKALDARGERLAMLDDDPDEEVRAGRRILTEIAAAWSSRIDPEIALRKAIGRLDPPDGSGG